MKKRVTVLHGVNLDGLDRRPAEHYGGLTFLRLEQEIDAYSRALQLECRFFQTNHEGEYVEELHRSPDFSDGLLLNPGAWTHYSWAIRDALELARLPAVEVHLSDVGSREPWRRTSVIRELCVGTVAGKGAEGYREGLELLKEAMA